MKTQLRPLSRISDVPPVPLPPLRDDHNALPRFKSVDSTLLRRAGSNSLPATLGGTLDAAARLDEMAGQYERGIRAAAASLGGRA